MRWACCACVRSRVAVPQERVGAKIEGDGPDGRRMISPHPTREKGRSHNGLRLLGFGASAVLDERLDTPRLTRGPGQDHGSGGLGQFTVCRTRPCAWRAERGAAASSSISRGGAWGPARRRGALGWATVAGPTGWHLRAERRASGTRPAETAGRVRSFGRTEPEGSGCADVGDAGAGASRTNRPDPSPARRILDVYRRSFDVSAESFGWVRRALGAHVDR